jgi:ribonuclease Z
MARQAQVRRIEPFHFSARYSGQEALLMQEVMAAFGCAPQAPNPGGRGLADGA